MENADFKGEPVIGNMAYKKKLIEVALPLEAINKESSREKSIRHRHGHPSTLHLWWSRKPLAACRGFAAGQEANVWIDTDTLIVKPGAALKQIQEDKAREAGQNSPGPTGETKPFSPGENIPKGREEAPITAKAKKFRRFYGTVEMDAQRLARDVGHTADEVVRHLVRLDGAKVKITLEIEAEIPNGAPDEVVRTVLENCKTLKFDANEFETE